MPRSSSAAFNFDHTAEDQIDRLNGALGKAFSPRTLIKFEQFATVNAARAAVKHVKAEAPVGDGKGTTMQKVIVGRRSRWRRPRAIVGPKQGKKDAWYAPFVVHGTKPHKISAGKNFKVLGIGTGIKTKSVQHTGTRPNNFVVRAANRASGIMMDAFAITITKLINDREFRGKIAGLEARYKNKKR